MIEALYEIMMLPDSCGLGKRVFKKQFYEHAKMSAADKKTLIDDVDTIIWQYALKPDTISIMPYEDGQREYLEVALLQANLKRTNRVNRLSEVIHRAIPYPVMLIFVNNESFSISLAHKRFSQAEKEAIVAEDFQATKWLDLSNPTKFEDGFLKSLDITTWPHTHFYAFYNAAMERVIALACAEHSGRYELVAPNGPSNRERRERLERLEKFLQEKSEIQRSLKKEKNLGTQVQLNSRIKQIKDRIESLSKDL